jgi:hypothetical protein
MHKLLFASISAALVSVSAALAQQQYEVPPSDTTTSNVPYISDEAMKECVRLYNEAKWLAEEIGATQVDEYSQESVDAYNAKVARHSGMTDRFNSDCAGKQSESAWRAAQELNNGGAPATGALPTSP